MASRTNTFGYPLWEFLAGPRDRFRDFYVQLSNTSRIEVIDFEGVVSVARGVFPLAVLLFGHLGGVAALTVEQSLFVYNMLVLLILISGVLLCFQEWFVRCFVVTSFPVLFAFLRGNNELLIFGIFLCAVATMKRNPKSALLVASLGMLIEPHLVFVFFIGQAIRHKMFPRIIALSAMMLLLASLYVPTFSLFSMIRSILEFSATQGQGGALFRLTHNQSLVASIAGYMYLMQGELAGLNITLTASLLGLLVVVVSALVVFFGVRKSKVEHVDLLIVLLSVAMILPVYSFSYRTIWLLYPLGVILDSHPERTTSKFREIQMVILALIILPKSWYVWSDPIGDVHFYEATLIDPILTLALLVVTLLRIHHENEKDAAPASRL